MLLALLTGPISVFVLLRRRSFMADALTHTVFPGVAIAFFVDQSLIIGAAIAALLSVVLLSFGLRVRRVDGDAMLIVLIGGFFSVGVVIVSRGRSFASDLNALLFGKILAVDRADIVATVVIALIVLLAVSVLAKEFITVAFDENAATAWGLPVGRLDLALNLVIALVIVASLKAVGTVLVVALIIVPAAIARVCTERIGPMICISTLAAGIGGWVGLAASYEASIRYDVRLAPGATVVLILTVGFGAAAAISAAFRRRSRAASQRLANV